MRVVIEVEVNEDEVLVHSGAYTALVAHAEEDMADWTIKEVLEWLSTSGIWANLPSELNNEIL